MMINIVIPMAGKGSRFSVAGFSEPKPLIKVDKYPMIELVIRNLTPLIEHRFIFICLREHIEKYKLDFFLRSLVSNCIIIPIDEVTRGAACTVLLAKEYINNDNLLMIANCDQLIYTDINKYLEACIEAKSDGFIMTMNDQSPKWSFVEFDQNKKIISVQEKKVVSDEATVGIYNFQSGCNFVTAAEEMINNQDMVNNEYYVAPVYNYLINKKKVIKYYNIGKISERMFGLGTPDDLNKFLSNKRHTKILESVMTNAYGTQNDFVL